MPAANLPPMVAPATPSTLEVNLRRLMAKCDAKVRGSDKILQGPDRTKYLTNIRALREMLADLEDELSRSGKVDLVALKEYAQKIESLESSVEGSATVPSSNRNLVQVRSIIPESKTAFEMADSFGSNPRRTSWESSNMGQGGMDGRETSPYGRTDDLLGLRERRSGRDVDREQISGISNHRNSLGITDARDAVRDQAQVEATLQNDRAQREEMEAGLSRLMQQLRHNAMAIHQTLADEQSSGLLDDADQALDSNISRLGKERTRLELYSKQSRKTKWMILGIVLGVSFVFVFMFFIIRIF